MRSKWTQFTLKFDKYIFPKSSDLCITLLLVWKIYVRVMHSCYWTIAANILTLAFDLEVFQRHLRTTQQCSRLLSLQKECQLYSACFNWDVIHFEALCGSVEPVLREHVVFKLQTFPYDISQRYHCCKMIYISVSYTNSPTFRSFCKRQVVPFISRSL